MDSLYDTDLFLWSVEQAQALREMARLGSNSRVDWENVAEEIESLGRSDRRALESQLRRIIAHLMKLEASPATFPRPGWHQTILDARSEIRTILRESPSLRREVPALARQQTPDAREMAERSLADFGEQARRPLDSLAYTEDQILGPWLP